MTGCVRWSVGWSVGRVTHFFKIHTSHLIGLLGVVIIHEQADGPTDVQKRKKNTSFPKYVFFISFIHILFFFFGEVIHFVLIVNRQLSLNKSILNAKKELNNMN